MTRREAKLFVGGQILARQLPDLPPDLYGVCLRTFGVPALVRLDDGRCVRTRDWLPAAVDHVLHQQPTETRP